MSETLFDMFETVPSTMQQASRAVKRLQELTDPVKPVIQAVQEATKPIAEINKRVCEGPSSLFRVIRELQKCRERLPKAHVPVVGLSSVFKEIADQCGNLPALPRGISQPLADTIRRVAQEARDAQDGADMLPPEEAKSRVKKIDMSLSKAIGVGWGCLLDHVESIQGELEHIRKSQSEEIGKLLKSVEGLNQVVATESETAKDILRQSQSADKRAVWAIRIALISIFISLVASIVSCCVAHCDAERSYATGRAADGDRARLVELTVAVTNQIDRQIRAMHSGMIGISRAIKDSSKRNR